MEGARRKNRLASLRGPYSHEWLNPCHPAMLAALRGCNVDAQVPYRLPLRCCNCGDALSSARRRSVIEAAQRAQDAQTGYCADYCAKCQPMAFHEISEFCKGHIALHKQLAGAGVEWLGKRRTARFLSDACCKGIVREQVECCNLRANHVEDAFVASKRFSATNFVSFPGRGFLHVVQRACGGLGDEATLSGPVPPRVGSVKRTCAIWTSHKPTDCDHGAPICGTHPRTNLSWVGRWLPRAPYTWQAWQMLPGDAWDVDLTASGVKKLENACKAAHLKPGADHTNRFNAQPNCECFTNMAATAALQHAWYFNRRRRPQCPRLDAASRPRHGPDSVQHNAALCEAYFRPWTLRKRWSTPQVPLASRLKRRRTKPCGSGSAASTARKPCAT